MLNNLYTILYTFTNIQVIDVGSGKGYLSAHLALQHGLTVVGVEAQETHTIGAEKRNTKVSYTVFTVS